MGKDISLAFDDDDLEDNDQIVEMHNNHNRENNTRLNYQIVPDKMMNDELLNTR